MSDLHEHPSPEQLLSTAGDVFDGGLRATAAGARVRIIARYRGEAWPLPLHGWCDVADPVDTAALRRLRERLPASATVLDVGCGPGRHAVELATSGVSVCGIDTSGTAVALARERGVVAHRADIFGTGPLRYAGWDGLLLLDGSIGLGGNPERLLRRTGGLLAAAGTLLIELDGKGRTDRGDLTLSSDRCVSAPFRWARLGLPQLTRIAGSADLCVVDRWHDDGRVFALLAPARRTG